MEEETGYSRVDIDTVDATDNSSINDEDYDSANESWSSYDNLPSEDFENNENSACSENVSDIYLGASLSLQNAMLIECVCLLYQEDVDVEKSQNSIEESFSDNLNQVN